MVLLPGSDRLGTPAAERHNLGMDGEKLRTGALVPELQAKTLSARYQIQLKSNMQDTEDIPRTGAPITFPENVLLCEHNMVGDFG